MDAPLLPSPTGSTAEAATNAGAAGAVPASVSVEGALPSNTAPYKYNTNGLLRVLRTAVDSLYVSYAGNISPVWYERLAHLKDLAQNEDPRLRASAQAKIGEHLFEVKDKGKGRYAFVLQDNAFHISISKGQSLPLAYVQVSSEFLAHKGVEQAEIELRYVVSTLGELADRPATISRVDLCADFTSSQVMDGWDHFAWVTRAESIDPHYVNHRFTGWSIGKGAMAGRLYDKTFEIQSKSHATHNYLSWLDVGWTPGETVYRLEAQFRREVLKELGVNSVQELNAKLSGLWGYFTQDWLRLTVPDPSDPNRSRWQTHQLWNELAAIPWGNADESRLKRFRTARLPLDENLFRGGIGYLSSYMAKEGITDFGHGLGEFLTNARKYYNIEGRRKGKGFDRQIADRIALKARLFNTLDNRDSDPAYRQGIDQQAEGYRRARDGGDADA